MKSLNILMNNLLDILKILDTEEKKLTLEKFEHKITHNVWKLNELIEDQKETNDIETREIIQKNIDKRLNDLKEYKYN